jgi:hypothetical protein
MVSLPRWETSDVRPRAVAFVALGLAATLIVIGLIIGALVGLFRHDHAASEIRTAVERTTQPIPPPRLQVDPEADLAELEQAAEARLNTLGWIDRNAGIAHIPIDEAMRRLAEQGWPSRQATP